MSADPELYRALHRGNPGDVDFYRTACAEADSILELGCGDGRVLFALAEHAQRAVGIERDGPMRAIAEATRRTLPWAARVALVDADMRDFDLGERFDRIVIPYSGLFCLPDDAAVVACFRRVAAHLTPDGALIFDGYQVVGTPPAGRDPAPEYLTEVDIGGQPVTVYEQDEHRPDTRDCVVTYTYHFPDRVDTHVIEHHYLYPESLPELLAEGGLALRALWGGFHGESLDDEADQLVVVAVLAED